jgi:hypothetical protein
MSLTACPDCQHELSTSAKACPHCGRPTGVYSPTQRELAKNVAGLSSGCFWFIVGVILLISLPITVPLSVYIIVKAEENIPITIAATLIIGALIYLKFRK